MDEKHVYEVIRYQEGVGLFLEDHLQRLHAALTSSGLPCDVTAEAIEVLYEAKKDHLPSPINMRIDVRDSGWAVHFRDPVAVDEKMYAKGVKVKAVPILRKNPNVKSDTDSHYAQMAQTYEKEGYFEYLLYDNGIIKEGARSNFFAVKDDVVYTQDNKNVLMGITRKKILDILEDMQIKVRHDDILIDKLEDFDGFFLSGTSIGVMPIGQIDGKCFASAQNTLIKRLIVEYNRCVDDYIAQHTNK